MHKLSITLTPHWENNTISSMEFHGSVDAQAICSKGAGLDYVDNAFGNIVPFPVYDQLSIIDDFGPVPYELKESPSFTNMMNFLGFYFGRPLKGTLKWSYRMYPRILPEGYSSSPYYDFRAEPYGLNGAGMFAFILPKSDEKFFLSFRWNMANMPEDGRGIWSYGEGEVEKALTPYEMRFSLFNVGVMNAVEDDKFGFFWFGQPEFEVEPVASRLKVIFQYMKEYFHDSDSSFRVFLRRDPFEKSGGGSACPYAFISGYSAISGIPDLDHWFNVLVHEMTHTWPVMEDKITGQGTWFTEGGTEFYCTMLPYRGGLVDAKYTVDRINEKIGGRYYSSVYREMPNMDIPAIQWQDRRAQPVPYGRGFMYLANVDAQLRRQGKSFDEIVLRHGWSNPMQPEHWMAFIREHLGDQGISDFENMKAGKLITPEHDVFGAEFATIEEEIELEGKMVKAYRWELK